MIPVVRGSRDVALVCLNGHIVNPAMLRTPTLNQDFCSLCGERTLSECPACQGKLHGNYVEPIVGLIGGDVVGENVEELEVPDAYCHTCGAAYPWVASRLQAARLLAQDMDQLTPAERDQLSLSLEDLVRDTPMTVVSANRFKRLVAKAGTGMADAFRTLLVDVMSEAAKKMIWPAP